MRLRLRWALNLALARLRPRIGLLDHSSIRLRVLPNDVDLRFVTNDRYLSYMDIGRHDLITRLGLLGKLRKGATIPLIRTQTIRYRHAARLLQVIELRSRVLCWEEGTVWFEQEFFVAQRSIALAYCEVELRTKAGASSMSQLLSLAGHLDARSPDAPGVVESLVRTEQAMRQFQRDHSTNESGSRQ